MTARSPRRDAARVSLAYAVLALLWIVGTDLLARAWAADVQQVFWLEALKAIGFVAVTAAFLYWWVRRDITGRRAAEERNALLATAVDAVEEAVFITDTEGRIQYVNPAFTAITGYSMDEALDNTPRMLKSGRQDQAFYDELWATTTSGRTFRGEMINRRKDGTLYDQEATITPVRENGVEIAYFVAVARDVTVRKEMERQVMRSYKLDAVGQMAAGISHDFRNLLNVIHVNAALLKNGVPSRGGEEARDVLRQAEEIETAAHRGVELVNHLLTLAKEKELDLRSVDLGEVVRDTELAVRALLPESVSLEMRIEDGVGVKADKGALLHILLNLAANAGHSMPAGGTLSLGVTGVEGVAAGGGPGDIGGHGSSYGRLWVEDTGTGIDHGILGRIFDPFFTTRPDGTGLGLATTRSLMHQHGGFVRVSSRPGRGTTFELLFPRRETVKDETDLDRSEAAMRSELRGGSERIMVVEDEKSLRTAVTRALTHLGYSVVEAANGRDALETIDRHALAWDLVLTDLVMPEMGGLELYETLQVQGSRVPFLFMSGYGPEEHAMPANPDRTRAFLQKPWTIADLASKVRWALDTRA